MVAFSRVFSFLQSAHGCDYDDSTKIGAQNLVNAAATHEYELYLYAHLYTHSMCR